MTKKIVALLSAIVCGFCAFAAITIDPATRTFDKTGGGNSVLTGGDGSWTATADVDWITISPRTSGNAGDSCVYIVDANFSADTRIGKITIGGKTHTITQTGYPSSLDKMSANFPKTGGQGTVEITVDNNIAWSAKSNDSWITLENSSGFGKSTITYNVAPYTTSVSARSGTITIGGNTFVVVQSGPLVTITPDTMEIGCEAKVLLVPIAALAETAWMPKSQVSWITLVDAGSCVGDGTITLAVNRNEGWIPRSGTVTVGDAVLTVNQAQSPTFTFAVDPVNATADPKGVYGKVNVIAPSDSPWVAESRASWITISSGAEGAGNGTVGYVASANPTTSERTGQIRFTPQMQSPDPDLYAGLLWWIKEQSNVEGNESRSASTSLGNKFNGSYKVTLNGTAIPAKDKNDFTFSFHFQVGELARINRLAQIANTSVYLDNDNRLVINNTKTEWAVDKVDTWYTVVLNQAADGRLSVYAGNDNTILEKVLTLDLSAILNFSSTVAMSNFNLGYAKLPTEGYLTAGSINYLRFWTRALTEKESRNVDVLKETIYETTPRYVPNGANWDLFTLDGNFYSTEENNKNPVRKNSDPYIYGSGWQGSFDRYGLRQKALCSTGNGKFVIENFQNIFNGVGNYGNNTYQVAGSELSATYVFWIKVDSFPSGNGKANIFYRRATSENDSYRFNYDQNFGITLAINASGNLCVGQSNRAYDLDSYRNWTTFADTQIPQSTWTMITFVGTDRQNIRVYINDTEAGNVASGATFGWVPRRTGSSGNSYNEHNLTVGGWKGAIDEVIFYHQAITSAQVRELYEASRVHDIYHTVTQGVVDPEFDRTNCVVAAAGSIEKINLTLPNNVNWSAKSNVGWIVIPTGDSGVGSAEISLNVTANPSVLDRSGTVTIAGKTINVYQKGLASSLSYDNKLIGEDGGSGTVELYTEGNAAWTAVSDVSWISIATGASGAGNGSIMYVVDPYTQTSASRTGTITIAGKKLYITQRGYELSIDPAVREIGCNAGQGEFGISASIDVVWQVIVTEDWITIVGDKSGNGDGTLHYTVKDNNTGAARTGKIIVAGEVYTITQLATLAVETTVRGHGVVSGGGGYKEGDEAVLRATPDAGYAFSCWTGDVTGSDNPTSLRVNGEKSVTAVFVPLAPQNALGTTEDTAKIRISWSALAWANTYRIYRSETESKPTTVFKTLAADNVYFDDTEVEPGETFYYWVEAVSDDSISCTEAIKGTRSVTADVTVVFMPNGGSGSMDDLAFASGMPRALTACAFTRTGYTFVGWARTAMGEVVFDEKQMVTDPGVGTESKVILYAQWAANAYTVKYSANGGSGEMSDQSFTYDTAQNLKPCGFTNGDSDFIGWATVANGSVVYKDQQSVKNMTTKAGGSVFLYAVWGADIPTYGPWGESDSVKNADKLGPTYLMNMPLTILGEAASEGDCVAVYRQDTGALCGLGKVLNDSGMLTVVCYAPQGVKLHFKTWTLSSGITNPQIYDCDARSDLVAPTSGSFLTGHSLVVTDKVDLTLTLKWSDDWHIISFNVEPDDKSPASVFGEVADKIMAVTEGVEFWMPGQASSLTQIQLGKAYWVKATQDSVSWTVSGRVHPETAIALEEGWNLVGYTLQDAGEITSVLATALAAGAIDFITYGVDFYPGVLTKMEPGKGYWVHATKNYTLTFDEPAAAPVKSVKKLMMAAPRLMSAATSPTFGPWGESDSVKNNDRLGPTCLIDMPVTIRDDVAARGDCVAIFRADTDELCGLGKVRDDSGKVTAVCYAPSATKLRFKTWKAATGEVIDCDAESEMTVDSVGSFYRGHRLVAEDRLTIAGVKFGDKPLKVERNWVSGDLESRFGAGKASAFVRKFGSDLSSAMLCRTGKFGAHGEALQVYHDYIAGTDPTDLKSKFHAKIGFKNGKAVVSWEPELTTTEAAKRVYTTYGKASLTDENWTPIVNGDTDGFNFFTIGVDLK